MKINPYIKHGAGRIPRLDSHNFVNTIKSGETIVAKVSPVKEVTHGFNASTLYLVQLSKIFRNGKKLKNKKKKFKNMSFFEFKEYVTNHSKNFIEDSEFHKHIRDEQLLFLQDILSSIEDKDDLSYETTPIIIDEEIENMNINEFRTFLNRHKELFDETGFFHYDFKEINNFTEEQLLEIKKLLIEKIRVLHDLFYYNKAISEYEKSYNNLAQFNSSGIGI